jgi:hypothetical protein
MSLSFTGSYNTRKLVVTLDPNGNSQANTFGCTVHYAPSWSANDSNMYV